jgi:hypothetical protein
MYDYLAADAQPVEELTRALTDPRAATALLEAIAVKLGWVSPTPPD